MAKDQQIEYINSQLNDPSIVLFGVVEAKSNDLIGTAKIGPINWVHRYATHAIMIGDKTKWNRGYGTELMLLIQDYGFRHLGLRHLYAGIVSTNGASIKKNERAGYKIDGIHKNKYFVDGQYVDEVLMSISDRDYFERHSGTIVKK